MESEIMSINKIDNKVEVKKEVRKIENLNELEKIYVSKIYNFMEFIKNNKEEVNKEKLVKEYLEKNNKKSINNIKIVMGRYLSKDLEILRKENMEFFGVKEEDIKRILSILEVRKENNFRSIYN